MSVTTELYKVSSSLIIIGWRLIAMTGYLGQQRKHNYCEFGGSKSKSSQPGISNTVRTCNNTTCTFWHPDLACFALFFNFFKAKVIRSASY